MIRFILKVRKYDAYSEAREEGYKTIDIEVSGLEYELTRGGFGEQGHHIVELVGAEILSGFQADAQEPVKEEA